MDYALQGIYKNPTRIVKSTIHMSYLQIPYEDS